ncbi:MAG: S46 family peptidase, partial [Candidatus Eremiobacterota bacterium]
MNRWMVAMLVGAILCAGRPASADEGMWLYTSPPLKQLKERYGFEPSKQWLEHLQRSSVRFNSGGSGSFVSSRGLVMTNHHVGAEQIQKLGGPGRDLLQDGFYAPTQDRELPCPDLELNGLVSVEDVTARVKAAVKPGMDDATAEKARRAEMNTIEKESTDRTGLRCDVVTLYQGGQYHLYRYKKYTDVRLVFAPEQDIAFFGGDADNFEYPRFDLDVTFFRAYENGKPAQVEHFLAWSPDGAKEGELTFVSGHPGSTQRQSTAAELRFQRDRRLPMVLTLLRRLEVLCLTYGGRSQENMRQAKDELFGVQNGRKALLGSLGGLQDPAFMQARRDVEEALRRAVEADPRLQEAFGNAWQQVEKSLEVYRGILVDYSLLERGWAFNSRLFEIARSLVRLRDETAKPNADRLREYRESNLESLRQELFSTAPIYPQFETVKLADSLSMLMELRGAEDPVVVRILAGKSPR